MQKVIRKNFSTTKLVTLLGMVFFLGSLFIQFLILCWEKDLVKNYVIFFVMRLQRKLFVCLNWGGIWMGKF